jgi:hypothetical protein
MNKIGLALAAILLLSQTVRMSSEDRTKTFLVGTYLGDEMRPDSVNPDGSPLHRTYYVRTQEGTWSLVSDPESGVALAHGLPMTSGHTRGVRPNLLDSLKRWDKLTFRVEPDRRVGDVKNAFLVYVPRANDPTKEDRFDADFTPRADVAGESADNVKAMCDAHRFAPEQQKQYCGIQ